MTMCSEPWSLRADADGLIKPKAFVVAKPGIKADDALAGTLDSRHQDLGSLRSTAPTWIAFIEELPKTATGKIERFKLRGQNAGQQNSHLISRHSRDGCFVRRATLATWPLGGES